MTNTLQGKPADRKGRYVRISNTAYDRIKKKALREGRTFISTLDRMLAS